MINELINLISSVGFPIAMCTYLTVTVNKTLESVRDSLNQNTSILKELATKMEGDE